MDRKFFQRIIKSRQQARHANLTCNDQLDLSRHGPRVVCMERTLHEIQAARRKRVAGSQLGVSGGVWRKEIIAG